MKPEDPPPYAPLRQWCHRCGWHTFPHSCPDVTGYVRAQEPEWYLDANQPTRKPLTYVRVHTALPAPPRRILRTRARRTWPCGCRLTLWGVRLCGTPECALGAHAST